VMAVEVVLSDGETVMLGGLDAEPCGYDLRGAFVGSEGMCGIATKVAVRLTRNPAAVVTMLAAFGDVSDAAAAVSAVIAAGVVPAAIEMLDQRCVAAVEDFAQAGYPRDAAAVLLVEVDGPPGRVADAAQRLPVPTARLAAAVFSDEPLNQRMQGALLEALGWAPRSSAEILNEIGSQFGVDGGFLERLGQDARARERGQRVSGVQQQNLLVAMNLSGDFRRWLAGRLLAEV